MTATLYQQVITILTIPPGNLLYHLVLAFSIAGTLPGAFGLWQRAGLEAGKRMVLGLSLLLLGQFILVLDAGLAQFIPIFEDWLPVLDRAVNSFSLVILIWLWVFPIKLRSADFAALLLSALIFLLLVLTGLWWLNQPSSTIFNGSPHDLLWSGLSLIFAFFGGLLTLIKRPQGYGIGLCMFALLFLGHLVYFFSPLPAGSFPGIVRLTQIAAYPLLLTLPSRFTLETDYSSNDRHGIKPEVFQQITVLAAGKDFDQVCQAAVSIVANTLSADIVLMVSPPDEKQYITLFCGYNLPRQEPIGSAIFDSHLVPVLAESLRQGRPLHLPAEGNVPDLAGIGKILNLSLSGSLLSTPLSTSSGETDKSLVLLSSRSIRSWTAVDQNYLADIAQSLGIILANKSRNLVYENKFSELNTALGSLHTENEYLLGQLSELKNDKRNSDQQIDLLQSELDQTRRELAGLRRKTSPNQEVEGSPK